MEVFQIKKIISLILFGLCLFCFPLVEHVDAKSFSDTDQPKSEEEIYKEMGYTKADKALKKFEKIYNIQVQLPKKYPFEVIKKYGKIQDEELHLQYVGSNHKIFKINILPGDFDDKDFPVVATVYTLSKGNRVVIIDVEPFETKQGISWLYFENKNVFYRLGLNHFEKSVKHKKLVEVAESILE